MRSEGKIGERERGKQPQRGHSRERSRAITGRVKLVYKGQAVKGMGMIAWGEERVKLRYWSRLKLMAGISGTFDTELNEVSEGSTVCI